MKISTNKLYLFLSIVFIFLNLNESVFAQSPFSRKGIGLLRYPTNAASLGMGGIGIAVVGRTSLPYLNPAGLSFINLTRFDGSFYYESADFTLPTGEGRFTRSLFNNFQVVFPVKAGYGLGLGIQPYSDVSYKFSRLVEFPGDVATESVIGEGGLQRAFIHLGGKMSNWLALGIGMDVYFGRIESTWRVFFNANSTYENTRDEISSYIDGIGAHAGIVIRLGKVLDGGAVFYFPTSLNNETQATYNFVGGTSEKKISTVKLPFSHGYGLSFTPNSRFQAGVDLFLQSWSNIDPEDFLSEQTENTYRLGLGLAYKASNDALAGFFSRLTYKLGYNTSTNPYSDESGNLVRENLFSFGLSVPFNFNVSSIDFGVQYGKRGSLDKNLAEETVFRLVVGITGGERWFVRR